MLRGLFTIPLSRRQWLTAAGSAAASGWLRQMAAAQGEAGTPRRNCILLWMNGGPSQTDTFDMKPGHAHGGPFQAIATSSPGITVCEHLPEMAKWAHRMSVIRSMSTKEGDHGRARDIMRTGYVPQASIQFPVFGSIVSNEYADRASDLPNYVSILGRGLFPQGIPPAGFLGPDHAPLLVEGDGEGDLSVENLSRAIGVSTDRFQGRLELLRQLEQPFLTSHPGSAAESHRSAYERSLKLMSPGASSAFDLSQEPAAVRERYGSSRFAQACLLARRLVERGVPFVEASLGGWDTHQNNFDAVKTLCGTLDRPWAALLSDLQERGLLDSTLVVWMGEFGRTPVINPQQGRDHYPKAWSAVLSGGGIQGGSVVGRTSQNGLEVEDRPVSTPDLLATICLALGLDPKKQNMSNVARPIRLVDPEAKPIGEILV